MEEELTRAQTMELHDKFEWWYAKVSRKGQRFTRTKALSIVVGAYYNRDRILCRAKRANPMDLTTDETTDINNDEKIQRDIERGMKISHMKVQQLRDELRELNLNQTGYKTELQLRLCEHFKCTLPVKAPNKGVWQARSNVET